MTRDGVRCALDAGRILWQRANDDAHYEITGRPTESRPRPPEVWPHTQGERAASSIGDRLVGATNEDVASWILVNRTAKEAMVDATLRQAEEAGLICGINRDHAAIIVTFDKTTSDWHCYLEFEEDV